MGTHCAPLPTDLFPHAFQTDFLQGLLKNKDRKLPPTINSSFRYIYDVLLQNNSLFGDYLHRIYQNDPEVKDTTDTQMQGSFLGLYFEIDNGGRFKTKLCEKRDDCTFPIVNFPFISSNMPALTAYGVYIHNSYAILEFVPSTVISGQSRADAKATSLQNLTVVVTIWMTEHIHISKTVDFFLFYVDLFFPLSLTRLLPDLTI